MTPSLEPRTTAWSLFRSLVLLPEPVDLSKMYCGVPLFLYVNYNSILIQPPDQHYISVHLTAQLQ